MCIFYVNQKKFKAQETAHIEKILSLCYIKKENKHVPSDMIFLSIYRVFSNPETERSLFEKL